MGKDKHRKRDRSSDSDDGRDSKKTYKDRETREEKMARRLAKKAAKRQQEEARRTICGYTDEDNRFGDSQLTTAFTWQKREEMLSGGEAGGSRKAHDEERSERDKHRRELARKKAIEEEVEKVKRRREEREREQAWMEEEKARMQRMSEEQQHEEWEKSADKFHLEQARVRAKIRIREGRAKPIDILAKNLHEDDLDVEMTEPYKLFRGLQITALEELQKDISAHQGLDTSNAIFWEAMSTVCQDELHSARLAEGRDGQAKLEGVHAAVRDEIVSMFKGKSLSELQEQEEQIKELLETDDSADTEFWETALKRLQVAKARSTLKDIHAKILRRRLDAIESGLAQESISHKGQGDRKPEQTVSSQDRPWDEPDAAQPDDRGKVADSDSEEEQGGFSPELDAEPGGDEVVDEAEDRKAMEAQRNAVLQAEASKFKAAASQEESAVDDEAFARADKSLGEDEVLFNDIVSLEHQVYSWHDKYRPRKPRFFNRVHTGYEWNKYNQTHYDHDNPPPKVVQGYKFNIFYPDLIDKSRAPTFRLESDSSSDTKILRFMAGPPYEDLAFRIVNKEWEYSHKRGFKCTFDRGILHLYFNFKRYRYRR